MNEAFEDVKVHLKGHQKRRSAFEWNIACKTENIHINHISR